MSQLRVKIWKNVRLIPNFSLEATKYAYEHWTPRKGDVFVVTYPKCGTHWMLEVVKQALFMRDPQALSFAKERSNGILNGQFCLESGPACKFTVSDHIKQPRVMFSHLPEELINFEKFKKSGAKIIYVYRNPKDQAVSLYHFFRKVPKPEELRHLATEDWDQFLKEYVAGEHHTTVPEGEWMPYHIKSWMKHKEEDNVLFVAYEDMKKDLMAAVRQVVEFLGVERTEEEIAEITKLCTFDEMQKASRGTFTGRIGIFRKGQVGAWKDQFTVAQSELMDRKLEEQMKGVDITFQYQI